MQVADCWPKLLKHITKNIPNFIISPVEKVEILNELGFVTYHQRQKYNCHCSILIFLKEMNGVTFEVTPALLLWPTCYGEMLICIFI